MQRALLLLFLAIPGAAAGRERYRDLVLADAVQKPASLGKVRVTYLGTNGYQFEAGKHALLVDPYFSRIGLGAVIFDTPIQPNEPRIKEALHRLAPLQEAILVTHGHVDHLFDAPAIMKMTRARLFASTTAIQLARAAGAAPAQCDAVTAGDVRRIGPWKIHVLGATHDRVFPIGVPFSGAWKEGAPRKASDWVCGEPLAFLIEIHGQRIYLDAGGRMARLPPANLGPVDLAILGVALPDSRARFSAAVRRLRPRYLLPSHQDDFFRPLNRGFAFGPLTDFPRVRHDDESEKLPGRLILLDYFRPWTLP